MITEGHLTPVGRVSYPFSTAVLHACHDRRKWIVLVAQAGETTAVGGGTPGWLQTVSAGPRDPLNIVYEARPNVSPQLLADRPSTRKSGNTSRWCGRFLGCRGGGTSMPSRAVNVRGQRFPGNSNEIQQLKQNPFSEGAHAAPVIHVMMRKTTMIVTPVVFKPVLTEELPHTFARVPLSLRGLGNRSSGRFRGSSARSKMDREI